ncbi:hypothetical protein GLOTRDRAFT_111797 [Gloeophyllum trabeum ATCC 11539]|uniref:Uncharacterized protein n=1 Tax=Gloeophyllum trabeum (strain ATCC 11539 / FP-39264 / Madison 617) TaxID=670483 RepID=S7PZ48_GLOTA|nr:uncharacterized protein GLOTRDRAFT_111797 [Gloeophyllum trabeum ATCC 11539]EPQ52921.1 hypothetical protein GLOTRDRAFT_111797 [Gloeophyllum trabeum ATCC 11539]
MAFQSLTGRQSAASPSVSLEKGAYRLRGPAWSRKRSLSRPLPTGRPGLSGPAQLGNQETQLAVVIVLLALATVSSFGAAYYLYSTSRPL